MCGRVLFNHISELTTREAVSHAAAADGGTSSFGAELAVGMSSHDRVRMTSTGSCVQGACLMLHHGESWTNCQTGNVCGRKVQSRHRPWWLVLLQGRI